MDYYDFLKIVRKAKKRTEFIKLNNELNNNEEFNKLRTTDKHCIKVELYDRFKTLGYKDSKNFSYLIATKPNT